MIHIFFVAGMFGSMIEMCLLSQTDIDGKHPVEFLPDGSAHSFRKQCHPLTIEDILSIPNDVKITTPIYPIKEIKLDEILEKFSQQVSSFSRDKKIFIYAPDQKWAEINILFQYHKISKGGNKGLEIFSGETNHHNIKNWNKDYTHWSQMARWEYREWFSLFYSQWVKEWIESEKQVSSDFLCITNESIICDTKKTLEKIINFCDAKLVGDLEKFVTLFRHGQQYVLNEYDTIKRIVSSTVLSEHYEWEELSIIGEAILQNQFRELGYEWFCDGLDNLPTNSVNFKKIIYKIEKMPEDSQSKIMD